MTTINAGRYVVQRRPLEFQTSTILRAIIMSMSVAMPDRVWVGGGVLRDNLIGVNAKDIDLCCCGSMDAEIVVSKLVALGGHLAEVSPKHYALIVRDARVDVLRTSFGSPEMTVRMFDLTCCSAVAYFDAGWQETMTLEHPQFREDCFNKRLVLNCPRYPRSTLRRVERFTARGWTIAEDEMERLRALAADRYLPDLEFDDYGEHYGVEDAT